jgi:vacuolar-type H+-ATPase subunit F/Vma7
VSEVAAIGEPTRVCGFALAGARVYPAEDLDQTVAAWHALPATVDVVILTPAAADALGEERTAPRAPLSVVMPA